jgi:histidinol phosphatase-like enzyme
MNSSIQPTIFLDMDGVIANFKKEMNKMSPDDFDDKSFRRAVKENKIFEKLELMPNAPKLLKFIKSLDGVRVEMLTSVGIENDPMHKARVIAQKSLWLLNNNISYKPNFVERMTKKGEYATPYSILVDDTTRAINAFNKAGGIGILYDDEKADECIDSIREAVYTIKSKIANGF